MVNASSSLPARGIGPPLAQLAKRSVPRVKGGRRVAPLGVVKQIQIRSHEKGVPSRPSARSGEEMIAVAYPADLRTS